jgi:hypothetical protein
MLLALLTLATVIGAFLLLIGKFGKPIDNHPICKKCHFDLTGLPETSHQCPECGAQIRAKNATYVGNRQRRPAFVQTGIALLLTGGLPAATLFTFAITGWNYLPYAPSWICLHEALSGNAHNSTRAFAELRTRLSTSSLDAIAEKALALQANPKFNWDHRWGELLEEAQRRKLLKPHLYERYLRQMLLVRFTVRPVIASDEEIFIRIDWMESRCGGLPSSTSAIRFHAATAFTVTDGKVTATVPGPSQKIYAHSNYGTHKITLNPAFTRTLGPGTKPLTVTCNIEVRPDAGTPIAPASVVQKLNLKILPFGTPSIRLVHLSPSPADKFSIRCFLRDTNYRVEVSCKKLPIDIPADVFVKVGTDPEQLLGTRAFRMNQDLGWSIITTGKPVPRDITHAKIILRPSIQAAIEATNITQIYGQDLIFTVPIEK